MRLITLLFISLSISFSASAQEEQSTLKLKIDDIENHAHSPNTSSEEEGLETKSGIKKQDFDLQSNSKNLYSPHLEEDDDDENEELSDSDQGMKGIFKAVGLACVTFVGCIVGVGGTIWLCIKGKETIQ